MLALRPHIGSESDFARRVDDVQRPEGYRLIARFVDGEEQAVAAAGFRVDMPVGRVARYPKGDGQPVRPRAPRVA